jgi:hypothetical protein
MDNLNSPKPLPFFFIGRDMSAARITNYLQQKHPLLSGALGKDETKNIWYSREHIAKLLEEIDHAGGDGLRVYFGAYEADRELAAGQLCLIMVPTRSANINGNDVHEDVLLEEQSDFAARSSVEKDIILMPDDSPLFGTDKDFNVGSPCPPECKLDGLKYPS